MSLISKLHRHPLHNTAHYKPFLERYHHTDFTALDHYRHLKQILPIYKALEPKLTHPDFAPSLPDDLSFALNRSAEIEKDIAFLEQHFPALKEQRILPSTQTYADQLERLDPSTDDGRSAIYSHFLLRILGDLFGGQGLKAGVIDAYKREHIYNEASAHLGTQFYQFRQDALKDFSRWLNALELENEDDIVAIATDAYQKHINIFDELESTRITKPSIAKNSSSFFNCQNLTKAVAVGTMALAAGIAVTATLSRLGM